ncbi:MAG: hypothetical protein IKY83_09070 [Proteobacteria bacterium]|nr:hypothetical protein [Pseudomonadota bacterium]
MIATLIIVLISIALQFFTPVDEDLILLMPLAALLLFFGPVVASPNKTRLSPDDKKAEVIKKWHTIPEEERKTALSRITSERFGKIALPPIIKILSIFIRVPFVIIAAIVSIGVFFNDAPHLSALIFDIICVPRALFFMIYGCDPADAGTGESAYPFEIREKVETVNYLTEFKGSQTDYQPQVQVELIKQGSTTDICDIRCNLVPKKDIPELLCSQFSITRNKVRDSSYSYAYLVFVFKGEELSFQHNNPVRNRIHQIVSIHAARFRLSVKKMDGNSVYVITKCNGVEYHTDHDDCTALAVTANEIFKFLEKNNISDLIIA